MKTLLKTAVAACALAATSVLSAAPLGTLSFLQPTGVVGPNDMIPVWMRFTLNADSPALVIDNTSGSSIPGLVVDWIQYDDPNGGPFHIYSYGTFTSVDHVDVQGVFGCSGTFTDVCDPGAYRFEWSNNPDSVYNIEQLTLHAGESFDYLWGVFVPQGSVAPGTYEFYYSTLRLSFTGTALGMKFGPDGLPIGAVDGDGKPILDQFGNPVPAQFVIEKAYGEIDIGVTGCPNANASCVNGFSRTVSAVPVPATLWLFGSGLLGLSAVARRRNPRTARR